MVHRIFLKCMSQRFARLLFNFTCSFVFMISIYSAYLYVKLCVYLFKLFPYISTIFLFADRWGAQSHQDDGGGLQHIRDIKRKWGDVKSQGHHGMKKNAVFNTYVG